MDIAQVNPKVECSFVANGQENMALSLDQLCQSTASLNFFFILIVTVAIYILRKQRVANDSFKAKVHSPSACNCQIVISESTIPIGQDFETSTYESLYKMQWFEIFLTANEGGKWPAEWWPAKSQVQDSKGHYWSSAYSPDSRLLRTAKSIQGYSLGTAPTDF